MGQYQQWLHFQEIDRYLRTTLDALEQELVRFQHQAADPLQAESLAENLIISALLAHMAVNFNGHSSPQNNSELPYEAAPQSNSTWEVTNQPSAESIETISAALLHWGELPDFGPQGLNSSDQRDALPFLSSDLGEIELLPEDMYAFFEEHARTDPQLELPWWLRKITITNGDTDGSRPIDQESIRTNRLVQRWVERWGRQSQSHSPGTFPFSPESEGISDEG